MFDHEMRDAAERVLHACRKRKLKVVTAESCTGGLVAATLTAIAGSSDVVDRAFVTYANEAKREMLGVSWDALLGHGAVSDPVARAMAAGALAHEMNLRPRCAVPQQLAIDQVIAHHRPGAAQQVQSAHRDKVGCPRAGPNQPDETAV